MNLHSILPIVLSLVVNFFMPRAIQFVAVSKKKWLNILISYSSSAVIGVITAYLAGNFSNDVWASILAGITTAQIAYKEYWKSMFQSDLPPVAPSS